MADLPYGHVIRITQSGSVDDPTAIKTLIWQTKAWWNDDFVDSGSYLNEETYTVSAIDQGREIRLKEQYVRADGSPGITNLYSNVLKVTNETPPGGNGDQLGNPTFISGGIDIVANYGLQGKIFVVTPYNKTASDMHPDLEPINGRYTFINNTGVGIVAMSIDQGESFILQSNQLEAAEGEGAELFGSIVCPLANGELMHCGEDKYLDYSGNTLKNVTGPDLYIHQEFVRTKGFYDPYGPLSYVVSNGPATLDFESDPPLKKSEFPQYPLTVVPHPTKDYIMYTTGGRQWAKIQPKSSIYNEEQPVVYNSETWEGLIHRNCSHPCTSTDPPTSKVWYDSYDDSWYMWFAEVNLRWDDEVDPIPAMLKSTDDGETWNPIYPTRAGGGALLLHPDSKSYGNFVWLDNFYRMAPNKVVCVIGWYGWNNHNNTLLEAPSMEGPWTLVNSPGVAANDGFNNGENIRNMPIAIDGKYLFYTTSSYRLIRLELV